MDRQSSDFKPNLAFTGDFPSDQARKGYINLIQAIRSRNVVLVQQLVKNGAPVNRLFDVWTLSPLHLAVQSRSLEIVRILSDSGADVNARGLDLDTPLILAAKVGDFSLIDALLSCNVRNREDEDHLSHLHVASMRNRVDIVKKLLSTNQGKNLNTPVKQNSAFWQGYTPLHFAVHFGCIETAEYLLKCGADMMAKNAHGLTPLHLADLQRNEKIIDILLAAHKYEVKNPFSKSGLSHFHIACTRDDVSVVENFLKSGVDINLKAKAYISGPWSHWSPIHFAIYYGCSTVIRFLKQAGARLSDTTATIFFKYEFMIGDKFMYNLITEKTESNQALIEEDKELHPFTKALIHENLERGSMLYDLLRDLLNDASTNLNDPIWAGGTILHVAVKCQQEYITGNLIDHGADILNQDDEGKTPLHLAFYGKYRRVLESILGKLNDEIENFIEYEGLAEFVDHDGLSIFHILCTTNQLQAIENCLCSDVDVNAQVKDSSELWAGFTALHFACLYQQVDVVELLLKNHADILITNKMNLNPFNLVVEMMVSDLSLKHANYFQILKTIFEILSTLEIESFSAQGISFLHVLCFDKKNDPEDMDSLKQCLATHQNEINQKIELNCKHCYDKCTPLHFAMISGNWEKAELLLKNGADSLALNGDGRTPMECAFEEESRVTFWAERAPTLFTLESIDQTCKPSHFHMACAAGRLDLVTSILETSDEETKKILINYCDSLGRTPLHALLQQSVPGLSRKQIAHLLLDNGADVNARDYKLQTPLRSANRFGDVEIMRLLIERGAEINLHDAYGGTVLNGFIHNKYAEGIILLLDSGLDINLTNSDGRTCLVVMYQFFSYEVAQDPENRSKGPDCLIILLKHVKKLELAGLYLNEDNSLTYPQILPYVSETYEEAAFIGECERELKSMETSNIDRYTSLRDVLTKNLHQMAVYCENINLRQLVESDNFFQRFPIYGPLVKLQIKNGATRRSLLFETEKFLSALINIHLPKVCLELILSNMNETDLKNIILSAKESETSSNE